MNKIVFPLQPGSEGAALDDLQAALELFLNRGKILPNDPDRRHEWLPVLQQERAQHSYGEMASSLVSIFQSERHLPNTGNVDVTTANSMNALLNELGVLDGHNVETRLVEGMLRHPDDSPSRQTQIFAFDPVFIGGAMLGQTKTNNDGYFQILYDPSLYTRLGPGVDHTKDFLELVVAAYDEANVMIASTDRFPNPPERLAVDLIVGDLRFRPELPEPPLPAGADWLVRGQVVNAGGPVNGIQVSVFDRDLFFRRGGVNTSQQLWNGPTRNLPAKNEDGWFEFTYTPAKFAPGDLARDGSTVPDLVFAFSQDGQALENVQIYRLSDGNVIKEETLVSTDDLILGIQARRVEEVRIVTQGGEPKPGVSQYELLIQAIEALLPEQAPASAGADEREARVGAAVLRFDEEKYCDISFVARETGFDATLIQALVIAFKLAAKPFENALRASVFYGLVRTRFVSDVLSLGRLSADDLRLALQQASTNTPLTIPPFTPPTRLDEAVRVIRDVVGRHLPGYSPEPGVASLADLVGADLPNPDEQAALWRTLSDHVGTPAEFWTKLKTQPGFNDPTKIKRLQYAFQLGQLARNNLSLVNAIRTRHPALNSTAELAFQLDTPEKWLVLLNNADLAITVPAEVPGKPEERKANYAVSLAGAIQMSHPGAAVANLVASLSPDHLELTQPAVAAFLTEAVKTANFDLVSGRIDDLVAQHGEKLLQGVEEKDRPKVIGQVKRLQRLFRLSTGPESLKVLLDTGFNSARELAELPSEIAMEMLVPLLGQSTAQVVLNRARNISAAAIHQYIFLNDTVNGVFPGGAL